MIILTRTEKTNDFIIDENQRNLYDHLTNNFFPPIREVVKESWLKYFTEYWNGTLTYKELIKDCPVSEDELIQRFDVFFFVEDLENEYNDPQPEEYREFGEDV